MPARQRPFQKPLALPHHLLGLLLAHRAPQQVGLAERVSGQTVGDLHHLLLVDDDAVGLFENGLQLRKIVGDRPSAVLALDEVVHHAALDRAGAVKRVERAQVLDAAGLVAAQDVAHARGFELEDPAGERLGEDLVGRRVVERQVFDDQLLAAMLFDQAERVVDQRQRGQPQEIHLEKAELLEAAHVVLGDDFLFVGAIERN